LPLRPHNPADVYYRKTRPDIYNNIGMVNENGEKWKELRNQLTPPLTKAPQNHAPQICQIIDDFIDVLETQATKFNRQIHGFKHQVCSNQ
jgi:ecdysone 20-monooxygenase